MRSLRSRLILGSSLIAVVPLALAMLLLARRIEGMVRTQAVERLDAALGTLQAQLGSDGERIAEKLRILARDPQLKRLYLLRPGGGRDLADHLEERRFLLGLDFLQVADTSGAVVADGAARAAAAIATYDHGAPGSAPVDRAPGLSLERLTQGAGLAMTASAPIRYENQVVGLVRGGLVLDGGFLARVRRTSGTELVLRDPAGRAVATSLEEAPRAAASGSGVARVEIAGRPYLGRTVTLEVGAPPHARVTGLVSTASADQAIAALQWTSALLAALGLGIAILLGVLWSSQVSRPVERLAAFSQRLAHGDWDEPLALHSVRELQALVAALDRMRADLKSYRSRLVTSERQAAWSQMARKVAHEVKNPLTPIAISIADLRRSYQLGRADFPQILDQAAGTITAEIENLKRLLQEFSDFARLPAPRLEQCRVAELWSDLETLYGHEVAAGRLGFSRPEREILFAADPGLLRQALVNLIQNGLEAVDGEGRVTVAADLAGVDLEIAVADSGPGLDAEQRARLFVPGFTTKPHGSGLGLTIVERIVNDHQGAITVDSEPGSGTTFRIRLPVERSAARDAAAASSAAEPPRGERCRPC
jgi:signal transduction histidine kinase